MTRKRQRQCNNLVIMAVWQNGISVSAMTSGINEKQRKHLVYINKENGESAAAAKSVVVTLKQAA